MIQPPSRRGSRPQGRARQSGFTLIEVMIAVLVLGVGLLGFALLQTTSVKMTQSSNYRTQATNLAASLLDQMRANRLSVAAYASAASFAEGSMTADACEPGVGTRTVTDQADLWKCQVVRALGDSAGATVTYNNGVAQVDLTWGERVGDNTTFSVKTQL